MLGVLCKHALQSSKTKHVIFTSNQTTHHLSPNNFGSLLKNDYQCYLDQNIYFTKRHHIMSNVPLNVNITKNRVVNSKGKMMKNHWEKLKTQSTTNRWKQTSVNIFLDFSANIFCYYKSSATPACESWKLELMDITRKYTESRKKNIQPPGKNNWPNEGHLTYRKCFILRWNKLEWRKS